MRSMYRGSRGNNEPHIHWFAPSLMVALWCFALAAAVGHHLLYQSLDSKPPTNQQWMIRAGTAFAVVNRLALTSCIGITIAQRVWVDVKTRYWAVGSLDDLFGAASSPLSLFNLEIWVHAKLVAVLALIIWLSPIVTVITPGTLTVAERESSFPTSLSVPFLNMSAAASGKQTLNLYETTTSMGKNPVPIYANSSNPCKGLVYESIFQGRIQPAVNPCPGDCSFSQSFVGPRYKCNEADYNNQDAPWCVNGTCDDLPAYADVYRAGNGHDGKSLWVRFRYFSPATRGDAAPGGLNLSNYEYENITFRCQLWNARYDVKWQFTGSQQLISGNATPVEPSPYSPTNVTSRDDLNSLAIHQTILSAFQNRLYIWAGGTWNPSTGLGLAGTPFMELYPWPRPLDYLPKRNLSALLEQLTFNITMSMYSIPNLVNLESQTADVTLTSQFNAYSYNATALVLTYAISLGIGVVALVIGAASFLGNGVSMRLAFSSILTTTRNPELDALARGSSLGAEGTMDGVKKVKLRFGEIVREPGLRGTVSDGEPLAAFGTEARVRSLKRGVTYY